MDYAKKERREAWLRHPVLGDPSFDNFEKIGETVHVSEAPYEWAVNGSIFRDPKTGFWYYYAGLYPYGYMWSPKAPEVQSHFVIYRSMDKGENWECLGPGFPDFDCHFPGLEGTRMCFPDVVMDYDRETDRYWLTYDWGARYIDRDEGWLGKDGGAALAWAKRPEGPFHKLKRPFWSNTLGKDNRHLGRFDRGYASSVFKRKHDWIAFVLQDSGDYFGWALACRTALDPEGEWSVPRLILSGDRPGYYPALMEFCFCMAPGDGKVYAPATSVAGNRNYQVVFAADLEQAEYPSAWSMIQEGSIWHARPLSDERAGIWGQTIQGFIEDDKFVVMYASKDGRDHGTLSVAAMPLDKPFRDGFAISGHVGKSIAPILAAYSDYRLRMEMTFTGTVEIFLRFGGILGPDGHKSMAVASEETFFSSLSVELEERGGYRILARDEKGKTETFSCGTLPETPKALEVMSYGERLSVKVNGEPVWEGESGAECRPLAVCAHEYSVLSCSRFEVEGIPCRYTLRYSAEDALLAAMQHGSWQPAGGAGFISGRGYIGSGAQCAKWNIRGDGFRVFAPKTPELGNMEIWVDGFLYGTADLCAEQAESSGKVYEVQGLPGDDRHLVMLKGYEGQSFAVDMIEVEGEPFGEKRS
nr:hypothetical protein [uncultured Acetatifactor sp.]